MPGPLVPMMILSIPGNLFPQNIGSKFENRIQVVIGPTRGGRPYAHRIGEEWIKPAAISDPLPPWISAQRIKKLSPRQPPCLNRPSSSCQASFNNCLTFFENILALSSFVMFIRSIPLITASTPRSAPG